MSGLYLRPNFSNTGVGLVESNSVDAMQVVGAGEGSSLDPVATKDEDRIPPAAGRLDEADHPLEILEFRTSGRRIVDRKLEVGDHAGIGLIEDADPGTLERRRIGASPDEHPERDLAGRRPGAPRIGVAGCTAHGGTIRRGGMTRPYDLSEL